MSLRRKSTILLHHPGGPNGGHDMGGNQGQGAPLDEGPGVSMVLAALYGGFVLYKMNKKKNDFQACL